MPRRALLLAPLLACHGPEPATAPDVAPPSADPPVEAAPPPPIEPSQIPPVDPARRCGEVGPDPTDLPAALRIDAGPLAEGVLHPGDRRTHGTVQLEYDPDRIVTPTDVATVRMPVLTMSCARDEIADGGAYGTYHELTTTRAFHLTIGPYRLDVRASADNQDLAYTLTRLACPDRGETAATREPLAFWLSTEAIRVHSHDVHDQLLQVLLDARGDAPRLVVKSLAYHHALTPRPDEPRSLRVGDQRVTIDRVVPGPHTRFEQGTWRADGDARLHARVQLLPLAVSPQPAPVAAASRCGDASPVRTTLPAGLGALPPARDDGTAAVDRPLRLDDLTFTLTQQTLASPRHRRPATTHQTLEIARGDQPLHGLSLSADAPALHRLDRHLLRVDPGAPPAPARVRRIPLACPAEHVLPATSAPVYVWLSTVGHRRVRLGTADIPPLTLTLHEDVQSPTFVAATANAHFSSHLIPQHIGRTYTLDDLEVEIVDIVPGGDTRRATHGWRSSALAPVLHVQVRVAPAS